MDRFEIARALEEIGTLIRLLGGSHHRARAYERGARALEAVSEDLDRVVSEGRLVELPGIGDALARQVEELYRTGSSRYLDELREEVPAGVAELAEVVSTKRARVLHQELGVDSVDALRAAAEVGRVRGLRGFGPKTEQQILARIRKWQERSERVLLVDAIPQAEALVEHLRADPAVARAEVAGSLRRARETVGTLRLVASGPDPEAVRRRFESHPRLLGPARRPDGTVEARLARGPAVVLHAASSPEHARALLVATGSRAHVDRLASLAGGELPAAASEEAIYEALGLDWVAPELREDRGEVEAAQGRALGRLLELDDVVGMIHCHTDWSDGKHTIEEMALEAEAMGMTYLTITDHSQAAHYAGGLGVDRLRAQWDEIARVQEQVSVTLLRGTESDILQDGALDFPDHVLEELDVIIASIHSRFKMAGEEMTRRIERAMRLPLFKIWGHALGRLVQKRDPVDCDVPRILDAIAESRAAIEVNGDPHRLDLPPEWIREAKGRGIRFVVSTDAHSRRGMHNLHFGVAMARRGGLGAADVLNTLPPGEFRAAVRPAD